MPEYHNPKTDPPPLGVKKGILFGILFLIIGWLVLYAVGSFILFLTSHHK